MVLALLVSLGRIVAGVICLSAAFTAAFIVLFVALTYPWGLILALLLFLLF